MSNDSTKPPVLPSEAATAVRLLDDWFDPIEAALRDRVRSDLPEPYPLARGPKGHAENFIHAMIEAELEVVLARLKLTRRSHRFAAAPMTATSTFAAAAPVPDQEAAAGGHRGESAVMAVSQRLLPRMPTA